MYVMDRHNNLLLGLMILTNCAWTTASYTRTRYKMKLREDTETLEATGTPAAGQSSSDGD